MSNVEKAKKALAAAHDKIREAGGSIIHGGGNGTNYTGMAGGGGGFAKFASEYLCTDPDGLQFMADMINAAADEGRAMAEMNAQRFTDPKCYSKPIVEVMPGCHVKYYMTARNRKESDCSGGGD